MCDRDPVPVIRTRAYRHSRRALLRAGGVAAVSWPFAGALAALGGRGYPAPGFGPLLPDPQRRLDLPAGFSYRVISVAGDAMSDGLRVPGLADGMHAFRTAGGRTVLVRNHELDTGARDHAFAGLGALPGTVRDRLYDAAVGAGGVSTVMLDASGLRVEREFLSLGGTLRNCAGGATPWGSWLSCEESVVARGERGAARDHGYAFEIPAAARALITARPLVAMGRFHREAVAVDPHTGIVYQTEDRGDGLLYRFVPERPGRLAAGGRLEALAVRGLEGLGTGNSGTITVRSGQPLAVSWKAVDAADSARDDLRLRGRAAGATTFRRAEGMAVERVGGQVVIWFVCTDAGPRGLGQIWRYVPSPREGGAEEGSEPGTLELFLEPEDAAFLNHGDNLALAPNGDLLVCEDNAEIQHLLGVTPEGGIYPVARNPRGDSELAGATFAPGGSVLYLNVQAAGLTLAVTGPWPRRAAP